MKRLFDVTISLSLLLLLSPLFLLVAIGIYMSDPGPVFYKAMRVGRFGIPFCMYKFRSMRISKTNTQRITSSNDSRIFSLGKVIRLLKIDELPQLINILKGEMSVIGPRPEDISIVKDYYDEILMESLNVKPGLASPGSIYNYTHLEAKILEDNAEEIYLQELMPIKVKLDVVYCKRANLLYDVRLIFRTFIVIILKAFGKRKFPNPPEYYEALKL